MNSVAACRLVSSTLLRGNLKPNCLLKKFLVNTCSRQRLVIPTGGSNVFSVSLVACHRLRPASIFYSCFSTDTEKPKVDSNTMPPGWAQEDEEAKAQRAKAVRRTKQALYVMCAFFTGATVYALFSWGQPPRDDDGNILEDEFSHLPLVKQYIFRAYDTIRNYNNVLKEPSRDLLLPPPLEHPYIQPPYTLVMELNGVLLNPEWTYKTGWRFKKRPLIDYFLQQCGPPLFETVIFTEDTGFNAFPLIDTMDPNGYIMHRLFRDSTRYEDGHRIKDLNGLNRDLKRVIHVDWDKNACKLNHDNCLILKKWDGDSRDKTLLDLAQFLRTIAAQNVDDVREIIRHYSQFEDPLEAFLDYQRQMAEIEEQKQAANKTSTFVSSFRRK